LRLGCARLSLRFLPQTAIEDRNKSFVDILRAENGFDALTFGVKALDCANREIGAPGNRFPLLKMGVL
jgi:hypothetical protein